MVRDVANVTGAGTTVAAPETREIGAAGLNRNVAAEYRRALYGVVGANAATATEGGRCIFNCEAAGDTVRCQVYELSWHISAYCTWPAWRNEIHLTGMSINNSTGVTVSDSSFGVAIVHPLAALVIAIEFLEHFPPKLFHGTEVGQHLSMEGERCCLPLGRMT